MVPSDLIANVDAAVEGVAQAAFNNLGSIVFDILKVVLLVYVFYVAITFLLGRGRALSQVAWDLVLVAIFLSVGVTWTFIAYAIYNVLTVFPDEVARGLLGGDSLPEILDDVLLKGILKIKQQMDEIPLASLGTYMAFVVLVLLPLMVLGAIATFLVVLSKLAIAVLFGLLPLFCLFAVFSSTREFFMGYLRQLFNYMLLPIILTVIVRLAYTLYLVGTNDLFLSEPSVAVAVETGFLMLVLIGLTLLAPVSASALAGGLALSTSGAATWALRKGNQMRHGAQSYANRAGNAAGIRKDGSNRITSRPDGSNRITRNTEGSLRFTRFRRQEGKG